MENMTRYIIEPPFSFLLESLTWRKSSLPDWWSDPSLRHTLFCIASEHEIETLVAHRLADIVGWDALPSEWRDAHETTRQRIATYLAELDRIAAQLAEEGIPLVALKNGGIARGIYPCAGCVPMGDLDVLVEKRHFRCAHDILLANGYRLAVKPPLAPDDFIGAEKFGVAEYRKRLNDQWELEFELHCRSATGRWIRPDQEPSTEELMARSIPIPGTDVRLLAPEDNLLQVALHTAKHTYVRAPGFRLHIDVERIVRAYPNLDWNLFLQRVKSFQVKTAVYFSLLIPHELFGTPIPEHVLTSLRPPAWKEHMIVHWLNRVGLFNPHEHKFSNSVYILFNSLLYDNVNGFFRALFPNPKWMREKYVIRNKWLLPYYYFRRILDLSIRHINT